VQALQMKGPPCGYHWTLQRVDSAAPAEARSAPSAAPRPLCLFALLPADIAGSRWPVSCCLIGCCCSCRSNRRCCRSLQSMLLLQQLLLLLGRSLVRLPLQAGCTSLASQASGPLSLRTLPFAPDKSVHPLGLEVPVALVFCSGVLGGACLCSAANVSLAACAQGSSYGRVAVSQAVRGMPPHYIPFCTLSSCLIGTADCMRVAGLTAGGQRSAATSAASSGLTPPEGPTAMQTTTFTSATRNQTGPHNGLWEMRTGVLALPVLQGEGLQQIQTN
jgi:hypothetical protein